MSEIIFAISDSDDSNGTNRRNRMNYRGNPITNGVGILAALACTTAINPGLAVCVTDECRVDAWRWNHAGL